MSISAKSVAALVATIFLLGSCTGGKKTKPSSNQISRPAANSGQELFTTHCVSCHALDNEEIGPKLGGVTTILSEAELLAFIKNPNQAIEAGNKRAVSLTRRYKMVMPPFDFLSDQDIKSILTYIDTDTKTKNIAPLVVDINANATGEPQRLGPVVQKSSLKVVVEDFVTMPPTSDKMPKTRIATMRPHPSKDGSLFISDQRGVIYRLSNGKPEVFLDIRPIVDHYVNEPGLGTGLGSFAFHPDYLNNGLIYITHTETPAGKKADYEYADSIKVALQWVVSEWKMDDVKSPVFKGSRRELLRINVPNSVHGMQDIGFMPDIPKTDKNYGLLYIGTGDGGSTISGHPELCHDLHSLLGTIIRIDPLGRNSRNGNYGIPADNPFANAKYPGVYQEIYAYGFRNPHRLSWFNGTLLSTEVGEANFEEINIIQKGGDYGWNVREGAFGISSKDLKNVYKLPSGDTTKLINPFAAYDHFDGAAISGGAVYQGPIAALKNKYIFGDILTGRLFYIDVSKGLTDPQIREFSLIFDSKETTLAKLTNAKRIDMRIDYNPNTGELYIMTKPDGKIRRVTSATE